MVSGLCVRRVCQLSLTTRFSGAGWVTVGAVLSTSAFSFTVVKRYRAAAVDPFVHAALGHSAPLPPSSRS